MACAFNGRPSDQTSASSSPLHPSPCPDARTQLFQASANATPCGNRRLRHQLEALLGAKVRMEGATGPQTVELLKGLPQLCCLLGGLM